ncbi:MAG: hypothetical protein M3P18_08015, partial [Actinomycetota bacterium]|nr:hypothetical protein [Actinomycetota bacterium]
RAERAFFSQLADQAGYQVAWDRVTRAQNIEASVRAMRGDERPLRDLLDHVTSPSSAARRRRGNNVR